MTSDQKMQMMHRDVGVVRSPVERAVQSLQALHPSMCSTMQAWEL